MVAWMEVREEERKRGGGRGKRLTVVEVDGSRGSADGDVVGVLGVVGVVAGGREERGVGP